MKIHILLFLIFLSFSYIGCSSGEYDIAEYRVDYDEKTLVIDTIGIITDIKEDITKKEELKLDVKVKETFTFTVQIGAFINKDNFERFLALAKQKVGGDVYYELQNGIYKIRIGTFNNRAEAMKYWEQARRLGYFDAFVITKKIK
ncbi:MAG: SPOR domain-containing protein [Chlorobi bacterium]|nr:SPOR domain-containing protein [Chlorobiota bacterium]MCI0714820.1 SPOR domain-containing protein [Chlorobiota bacterium]